MDSVTFTINGKLHTVPSGGAWMQLVDYIRDVAKLKGTKVTCREGSCCICLVAVTTYDHVTKESSTFTVNSCLWPVYCADGWHITTIEGVGNKSKGYHMIQKRVADMNATQCGFCTPGVVMSMYGMLASNPNASPADAETAVDGNVCRCTGYRPIMAAAQSLTTDGGKTLGTPVDIEDLTQASCGSCKHSGSHSTKQLSLKLKDGREWHRVLKLEDVLKLMNEKSEDGVKLLAGNTGSGVLKKQGMEKTIIDLRGVKELQVVEKSDGLTLGANLTLTQLIQIFKDMPEENSSFRYLRNMTDYMTAVGNIAVRNVASWAGNLMLKHTHPGFPSDLFTIFEAAGAEISVCDADGNREKLPLREWLSSSMKNKVVVSLTLPQMADDTVFMAHRVSSRNSSTYAYVNAAFVLHVDKAKQQINGTPRFVFGGIHKDVVHATKTEELLTDKALTPAVVSEAFKILEGDLKEDANILSASPQYKKNLAVSLLYKFFLKIFGEKVPQNIRSGADVLQRPLSSGQQDYEVVEDLMGKPVKILSSLMQTSGDLQYTGDMPNYDNELYAALVLSKKAKATIGEVDISQAMSHPGVVRVLQAEDLPAENTYQPFGMSPCDELLSSGEINHAGQPIAIVIAESQVIADQAAEMVTVNYEKEDTPVLTIKQAIEQNSSLIEPGSPKVIGKGQDGLGACSHVIEGEFYLPGQFQVTLETHSNVCVPRDDVLDLWVATQCFDQVQAAVARVTGKPMNKINVTVPQLGGGFGGKMFFTCLSSCAGAVAATVMHRPVRMNMSLSDNLNMPGSRSPYYFKYKVGFSADGKINTVVADVYCDNGHVEYIRFLVQQTLMAMDSAFNIPNWHSTPYVVKTNKPGHFAMRSPAMFPALFFLNNVIEHVAKTLDVDPIQIRAINMYKDGQTSIAGTKIEHFTLPEMWTNLQKTAEVAERQAAVHKFNQENKWRKKGLSMTAMRYPGQYMTFNQSCFLAVHFRDGSITVCHSGVEMGQGIHTKVAQVVAKSLGVAMDSVSVYRTNQLIGANALLSAASLTSENCVAAAVQACEVLKTRMAPVREANPDADWQELVKKSHAAHIDLTVQCRKFLHSEYNYVYTINGACVSEVEVDILTGQYQINRVDILMDVGQSLNPLIDVGQVEGAFVMGMGYLLSEEQIRDPKTGCLLTDNFSTYKVPMAKDIPVDFRVNLLKGYPNPLGCTPAKALGEHGICLSVSVPFAIRSAIEASREERGLPKKFTEIAFPLTAEKAQLLAEVRPEDLVLE